MGKFYKDYIDYLNDTELVELKKKRETIFESDKNPYIKKYLRSSKEFDLNKEKMELEKRIKQQTIYKHYREKWVKLISIEQEYELIHKMTFECNRRDKKPLRISRENLLKEIKIINNRIVGLGRENDISLQRIGNDKKGYIQGINKLQAETYNIETKMKKTIDVINSELNTDSKKENYPKVVEKMKVILSRHSKEFEAEIKNDPQNQQQDFRKYIVKGLDDLGKELDPLYIGDPTKISKYTNAVAFILDTLLKAKQNAGKDPSSWRADQQLEILQKGFRTVTGLLPIPPGIAQISKHL